MNNNITNNNFKEYIFEVFNEIPSSIFIIDKNLKIIYYNKSFKNLFETSENFNESCGKTLGCEFQLKEGNICGTTFECSKCEMRKNFILGFVNKQNLKTNITRKFKIGNKIANKHLCFTNKQFIYNNEETLIVFIEDNTEIEQQKIQLNELLKLKNEFIQIASHDIRNPLTAIYSFADLLINNNNKYSIEKTNQFLNIIKSSSKFSIELLNDLLDYSIIESGDLKLRYKLIDYNKLLVSIIEINQVIADNKKIIIEIVNNYNNLQINIDKDKIEQVINNLLSNAIKYSNKNSLIKVIISIENNMLLTNIKDFGQGIKKNEIENLFIPFNTTSAVTTGGEKSTGLGLVISKKIIEAHKGNIYVESEIGIGTEFSFSLPI